MVIAVRNEARHLRACLEAVLGQDLEEPFEVVVVDGHSTDGTQELLAEYPVRVVRDSGVGVAEARNRGIEAARGQILAFTDGDCRPAPDWLSRLVARLDGDPGLEGVGGGIHVARVGTSIAWYEDVVARALYRGFITSNVAYRRRVLLEVGGFDPEVSCAEDFDLYWRVVDRGYRVAFEPRAVVTHAPAENEAWPAYVRKQFWYSRSDMATFHRRLLRVVSSARRGKPVRARLMLRRAGPALLQAAGAAGLLAGAFGARRAGVVGAAVVAARVVALTEAAHRRGVLQAAEASRFAAVAAVKEVARGVGGLVGVARALASPVPEVRRRERAFHVELEPVRNGRSRWVFVPEQPGPRLGA